MTLRLVTPATTDVVSLAELKKHVRAVYHDDDDAYLQSLAAVAVSWIETWLGIAIASQTWEFVIDDFSDGVVIPIVPISSIQSIVYDDKNGAETPLDGVRSFNTGTNSRAYALPPIGNDWPEVSGEPGAVRVTFVAGGGTVKPQIKHAVLLLVGGWYENRESVSEKAPTEIPYSVEALLLPLRNWA